MGTPALKLHYISTVCSSLSPDKTHCLLKKKKTWAPQGVLLNPCLIFLVQDFLSFLHMFQLTSITFRTSFALWFCPSVGLIASLIKIHPLRPSPNITSNSSYLSSNVGLTFPCCKKTLVSSLRSLHVKIRTVSHLSWNCHYAISHSFSYIEHYSSYLEAE